jgi:hypothetical protein
MIEGNHRARKWFALLGAAMLAGCVNPAFRESVGEYGALTKASAAQQNGRVAAVAADEAERIRADLAARRVDLRLSADCAAALAEANAVLAADPGAQAPTCSLVERGGKPVEQAPGFANIIALTGALADYSDTLILLAADSSADEAAFGQSVTSLGNALGGLDSAVRQATGAPAGAAGPEIGAVATLMAETGSLYLEQRRGRALKEIVIRADPLVQQAANLLSGVDDRLQLYYRADLARTMLNAQNAASAVVASPTSSEADIRTAQDALFAAVAQYNAQGADTLRFKAIGAAHAKLAQAARKGASAQEMAAAIEAIIHLAGTADATVNALKPAGNGHGGSDQDGN